MNNTYFYHDKPVFGLDIGFNSLKVMQIGTINKRQTVEGYGVGRFDAAAITDGVITDYEALAKVTHELFEKNLIGNVTTRRAVIAIPANRTFNRSLVLPKMSGKDMTEAIRLEAEQYIPVPVDELYMDYEIIGQKEDNIELLAVAVPKKIIDSYMVLADILGIEIVAMETTINAAGRLFVHSEQSDIPTILIDFGSIASDITIYDKGIIVTGTAPGGGDSFTNLIADKLNVSKQEAHVIKTKYGLGASKKQKEITEGVTPLLEQLLKEIRRVLRYYEDRSDSKSKIGQIVTMGGGANMPGLAEYMTDTLRLPVHTCDPWQYIDFSDLQPPNSVEKSMYATVTGLALLNPRGIFI
jgi:type IV pilus assembly protein PilM